MGLKSGVREPCISVLQVVHAHSKITFGNATIKQGDSNSKVIICIDTNFRLSVDLTVIEKL